MAESMGKLRAGGVSDLEDSVDLSKVSKVAESLDPHSRAREVCAALTSEHTLLGPAQCAEFSEVLEFDARRLCAAHNLVVVSALADSVRMSTLYTLLKGLLDSQDEVDGLLIEMITAQPQSKLNGAVINEVAGVVRFRPHTFRNREWAEYVYRSL